MDAFHRKKSGCPRGILPHFLRGFTIGIYISLQAVEIKDWACEQAYLRGQLNPNTTITAVP